MGERTDKIIDDAMKPSADSGAAAAQYLANAKEQKKKQEEQDAARKRREEDEKKEAEKRASELQKKTEYTDKQKSKGYIDLDGDGFITKGEVKNQPSTFNFFKWQDMKLHIGKHVQNTPEMAEAYQAVKNATTEEEKKAAQKRLLELDKEARVIGTDGKEKKDGKGSMETPNKASFGGTGITDGNTGSGNTGSGKETGGNRTVAEQSDDLRNTGMDALKTDEARALAEEMAGKYGEAYRRTVDPKYTENLATWLPTEYKNGKYTPGTETTLKDGTVLKGNAMQLANEKREQLKEVKAKIKETEDADERRELESLRDVLQSDLDGIKGSKEYKDGFKRFLYLMVNKVGSALVNTYTVMRGMGKQATADVDTIRQTNMGKALERYNQKWETMAKDQSELMYDSEKDRAEAYRALQKLYSDSSLRGILLEMSIADKRRMLEFAASNNLDPATVLKSIMFNFATSENPVGDILDAAGKAVGLTK